MPAVSKKQQKFFGIVRAIQKGDAPASKFSKSAQKAAKTMKKKDVKDFADTDRKGLPKKVQKEERDYKAEYKKFQSSPKMKKYRAELNQYNRKRGTYGNGDGKDASHKGGKIAGFEKESTNRGRAEKSRLKKEGKEFTDRQLASRIAYHANLHKGTGVGYANAFAQIGMFLRDIGYKKSFIEAVKVMKVLAKKKKVESVNEAAIGKVGIGFFIDQLTNAMDHYNEREFVSHLNRELEIDKKVLKRVWKNYLKVSPRYKTKWLPRNWEKWLERQGIVESVNEGADYSKVPTKKLVKTYKQMADERLSSSAALTFRLIAKELIKRKAKLEGTCGYAPEGKVDVHNTDKLTPAGPHLLKKQKKKVESMNEKVIKVSKKDNIPGNPMKMKGEEKIKKLVYSGSIKNKGSYEIKGNKLNVNNIRPRDKGFFVRHFTMGTGFRKANLYYDGVHWQGKKEF
tara:strand:- start:547 stop:1908 length:1362 start_codon:yes stop_codon:yes gene_type:complete